MNKYIYIYNIYKQKNQKKKKKKTNNEYEITNKSND